MFTESEHMGGRGHSADVNERQDGQYCKAPDKEEAVDHSASELGLKWEEGPLSGVMERKKGDGSGCRRYDVTGSRRFQ